MYSRPFAGMVVILTPFVTGSGAHPATLEGHPGDRGCSPNCRAIFWAVLEGEPPPGDLRAT